MHIDSSTSIRYLKGVGSARAEVLAKLNIFTCRDLLEHYPVRYEDRSAVTVISALKADEITSVCAQIIAVQGRKIRAGLHITTVKIADNHGTMNLLWFNQAYREKLFKPGLMISAYGKVERNNFGVSMLNPDYELFDSEENLTDMGIVPIYRLTEGITGKTIRNLLTELLNSLSLQSQIPKTALNNLHLTDYQQAVHDIHMPSNQKSIGRARERLVFEEFFALQACILLHRFRHKSAPSLARFVNKEKTSEFISMLPFDLTNAQRGVWQEIQNDLVADCPMERLIQGDVGSGKTVISALALISAFENGWQGTLMAPTEVLATQHYNFLQKYFTALNISAVLLTGKSKAKAAVLADIASGKTNIVIGTHAIIQDKVEFFRLGLVVTDEQHRFGVEQRSKLKCKGNNPHMLVMTATPIPRTLALTVFGDMDISTIRQLPPGRKTVKTYLRNSQKRQAVYSFALQQVAAGRQVFVVCPLIEESDKLQTQSAVELFEELSTTVFSEKRCILLHGQLKQTEKDTAMQLFSQHLADVMIATTVIEVGIDVPNASVMIIEGADRFGLSQLHQLRGRVGRGEHQSFCVLLSESSNPDTIRRLSAFAECNDGFEIADLDLQFRGVGQFFGLRQHGLSDLKIGDIIADYPLMITAKTAVTKILRQPGGESSLTDYLKTRFSSVPELLKN